MQLITNRDNFMRFEVLTAVTEKRTDFPDVGPRDLLDVYHTPDYTG
jgi:hypothetical protein